MTASTPLQFMGVSKTLAGHAVLDDVSFSCPAGTVTALLGPNGAGKTTAVTLATGLRRPGRGAVRVFGLTAGTAPARAAVALVPQEIGFPDAVGVTPCLDFVELQREPSELGFTRAELVQRLGLGRLLDRRIGALSGGQRRKLAVALGLLRAPALLLLDEATTNLDENARAITWRLIADYAGRGGAVLVTSHILSDIETGADRVVALNAGRVVVDNTIDEVRGRLGGSVVTLRLRPRTGTEVVAAAVPDHLGHRLPGANGAARWRTQDALALIGLLAEVAPSGSEVTAAPMPLGEVLDCLISEEAFSR